jgi:hypothetical protein
MPIWMRILCHADWDSTNVLQTISYICNDTEKSEYVKNTSQLLPPLCRRQAADFRRVGTCTGCADSTP